MERDEVSECKFDLQPLYCGECGAYIGTLGTCDDFAWCERCNSKRLRAYEAGARSGHDLVYSPQYEKGKPPMHAAKVPRHDPPEVNSPTRETGSDAN